MQNMQNMSKNLLFFLPTAAVCAVPPFTCRCICMCYLPTTAVCAAAMGRWSLFLSCLVVEMMLNPDVVSLCAGASHSSSLGMNVKKIEKILFASTKILEAFLPNMFGLLKTWYSGQNRGNCHSKKATIIKIFGRAFASLKVIKAIYPDKVNPGVSPRSVWPC